MIVLIGHIAVEDVKYEGEHNDEDGEEEQEHLEIDDDIDDHGDDVAERAEDTHEEERLHQQQEDHDYQDGLREDPASSDLSLQYAVAVAQTNVHDVDVVPWILEILYSLLYHLGSVVDKWVN